MPTLRDVMLEQEEAAAAREAAALRMRGFGQRFQEPMPEGVAPTVGGTLAAAADPLGIPSYAVGKVSPETRDAWREFYSENPSDAIFGSLAPVPFAGPALQGAGAIVRGAAKPVMEAAKAFPKTMASVLGLGGATTAATEAAEGSKQIRAQASAYDPEINDLKERIKSQEAKLSDLGGRKSPEPGKFKSERAQRAAEARAKEAGGRITKEMDTVTAQLEKNRQRLTDVENLRDSFVKEAAEKEKSERPLVERIPAMGGLAGVGGAIAAAAAYNPRLRAVMAQRQFAQDLNMTMPQIEAAAGRTALTKSGKPAAKSFQPTGEDIVAIEQGRELARSAPAMRGAGEGSLVEGLKAAPAGMAAAAEGAMLPYQIDWANAAPGTPAYEAAVERFTTLPGWLKTGVASLVGGTGSMVGAKIPTHRAPATTLESDLARAQGAVNAFDMRKAAAAAPPLAATPAAPNLRDVMLQRQPAPAGPALTKAATESKRAAGPEGSAARVEEARRRMDEAFTPARMIGGMNAERAALLEKIRTAKSAQELREASDAFWKAGGAM